MSNNIIMYQTDNQNVVTKYDTWEGIKCFIQSFSFSLFHRAWTKTFPKQRGRRLKKWRRSFIFWFLDSLKMKTKLLLLKDSTWLTQCTHASFLLLVVAVFSVHCVDGTNAAMGLRDEMRPWCDGPTLTGRDSTFADVIMNTEEMFLILKFHLSSSRLLALIL